MAATLAYEQSVFLNVPYDKTYEDKFVALVLALVALGRIPRCVVEITEVGTGRLDRILRHLESCRVSVHDLSYVNQPVRFNMPFELGLACGLQNYGRQKPSHIFLVLEAKPRRLDKTLSDLRGIDPLIHGGKPKGAISCILDALGAGGHDPSADQVYALWEPLWQAAQRLKKRHGRTTLFHRGIFKDLVTVATVLAEDARLIHP